jgi:CheY-like chemotaxis protein
MASEGSDALDLGLDPSMAGVDLAAGKVLIVDDNQQNLELIQAYMESLPCRIEVATDGAEAMASIAREQPDRRGRRAGGCEHARPQRNLIAGHAGLGDRRHVGQRRETLQAADAQHLQLARLDLRQRTDHLVHHHHDLAAEEIAHGLPGALVRYMGHRHAQFGQERLGDQVAERAGTGERTYGNGFRITPFFELRQGTFADRGAGRRR